MYAHVYTHVLAHVYTHVYAHVCTHVHAQVLEQDYRTRRAGQCNAAGFRKSVTIGRGRGITNR